METENNPYQPPTEPSRFIGSTEVLRAKLVGVFKYAYFTSFAVAFTVVAIWMLVLFRTTPPTGPPDVLGVIIMFFYPPCPVFLHVCVSPYAITHSVKSAAISRCGLRCYSAHSLG